MLYSCRGDAQSVLSRASVPRRFLQNVACPRCALPCAPGVFFCLCGHQQPPTRCKSFGDAVQHCRFVSSPKWVKTTNDAFDSMLEATLRSAAARPAWDITGSANMIQKGCATAFFRVAPCRPVLPFGNDRRCATAPRRPSGTKDTMTGATWTPNERPAPHANRPAPHRASIAAPSKSRSTLAPLPRTPYTSTDMPIPAHAPYPLNFKSLNPLVCPSVLRGQTIAPQRARS